MEKISQEEFERARNELLSETGKENLMNIWLDVDTFKLVSAKEELQKITNVSAIDVQKVAEKLMKEPTVTVLAVKSKITGNR